MKHGWMAILVLVVLLATGATAFAQDPIEVTVGVSWNQYDVSLVNAWETYMQAQAEEQGPAAGVTINWIFNAADGDPARQAANIEDLINQGVDIIVARAEDGAAIGASIRAANELGIPFITFDRTSATTAPVAHVGGDSYLQGRDAAEALVARLEEAGATAQCIEMQGSLTDANAVNRSVAWNEVDAESDAFETVVQVPTEWDATLFLSGATNALQAYPDANCFFLASDFAINSVQSALESAGKWAPIGDPNHVWLATADLFPEAYVLMLDGYIDVSVTYDAFAHAQELVRVVIDVLQGEDPGCGEDGCLAQGRLATPENAATLENLWARDFAG